MTKVEFTNLDKIMYPEPKITKAHVVEYYIRMAPKMLGILTDRPIVLTRFPNGVGKEGFYEKDAPLGTPPWVHRFKKYSKTAEREINYVVCNDLDTLVWLANLATIELHMTLSETDASEKPDLIFFDIDPEPPANITDVVEVALLLKQKLDELSLRSYVKTSGKKGLHILIPVVPEHTFRQTREFVHQIGKRIARETSFVASEHSITKEPGKIYIDYMQNSHGRTAVCPYSLRATPQATVSMPIDWKDLKKGIKPETFTLFTTIESESNPWKGMLKEKQKLERSMS